MAKTRAKKAAKQFTAYASFEVHTDDEAAIRNKLIRLDWTLDSKKEEITFEDGSTVKVSTIDFEPPVAE